MKPDLFVVPQFFEPGLCETMLAELRTLAGHSATLYGRNTTVFIDERARKTIRLDPADETIKLVITRLWACKDAVEKHFAVMLKKSEETPFLCFRGGGVLFFPLA